MTHRRHDHRPARPDDLDPHASPSALLEAYQQHLIVLAAARADPSREDRGAGERAVAALAIAHAVIADLSEERWPIVRDALVHGVAAERVSAATGGLEPDELAAGLTAWADRQWAAGRMGEREHLAVLGSVGTWMRSAARPRAWL
jgi:hypothetical protein